MDLMRGIDEQLRARVHEIDRNAEEQRRRERSDAELDVAAAGAVPRTMKNDALVARGVVSARLGIPSDIAGVRAEVLGTSFPSLGYHTVLSYGHDDAPRLQAGYYAIVVEVYQIDLCDRPAAVPVRERTSVVLPVRFAETAEGEAARFAYEQQVFAKAHELREAYRVNDTFGTCGFAELAGAERDRWLAMARYALVKETDPTGAVARAILEHDPTGGGYPDASIREYIEITRQMREQSHGPGWTDNDEIHLRAREAYIARQLEGDGLGKAATPDLLGRKA